MPAPAFIPSCKLEAMRTAVSEAVKPASIPESLRLKRINDEKAARRSALEAERKAKENERAKRLAEEEAARIEVDRQEEAFREAERKKAIEAANRKLWNQSDKVRGLHASMLLSEVLAEREAQTRLKEYLEGLEKSEQASFHAKLLQSIQEEEAVEARRLQEQHIKSLQLRAMQDEQLEELRRSILAERESRRLEGVRLQQAAELELQEATAKAKSAAARERAKLASEAMHEANTREASRAAEKEKERLADLAMAEHANQQQKMENARRAEKEANEAEKAAHRQAMVEVMERTYKAFLKETDEQLSADVAAADEMAAAAAAEKLRREQAKWQAIDRIRQQQLKEKQEKANTEKAAAAAFAKAWQEQMEKLQTEEMAEAQAAMQKHRQYVAFLQKQIDLKEARKRTELTQDAEEDVVRLWALSDNEAMFEQYAAVCVDEWRRRGRDAKAMQLFLKSAAKQSLSPSL